MKAYRRLTSAVVLATICVLSPRLTASAAGPQPRPLEASFTGGGLAFTGNATHLGLMTGHVTSVTLTPTGAILTGTWVAANGDEVFNSSVLTVTGVTPAGALTYIQTIDITGGTGRFAGATGHVIANGETAPDFSWYSGDAAGWIRY